MQAGRAIHPKQEKGKGVKRRSESQDNTAEPDDSMSGQDAGAEDDDGEDYKPSAKKVKTLKT